MASSFKYQLIAAAVALCLVACGKGRDDRPTQVAAKVNGDEITVHQVNQAMQRLGKIPEGQLKQAQKQALASLVDEQLLVHQAVETKLDRDPRIVAVIEAAKRQILARAYIEKVTGVAQKAPSDQIYAFYTEHPELFQERRVYRFAQLAIVVPTDKQQAVRAKLEELDKQADKQKILPQLGDWLKTQNLRFQATQSPQAAEQLPLEALQKYQKMKVGDLLYTPGTLGVVIAQLMGWQSQPLTMEQAQPFIEQYLQNRERLKLSDDEMKRLRTAGKIEYVGEFAQLAQREPASTPASVTSEASAVQAAPAGQGNVDHDAMAKGVKALK